MEMKGEVIVTASDSRWFTLRGTAIDIWHELAAPRTTDEVAEELESKFKNLDHTLRSEVARTAEDWLNLGLLVVSP
jgi:hypothetical protein